MSAPKQVQEAGLYVAMLCAAAPPGSLLDIRYRETGKAFSQLFLPAHDQRAGRRIATLGRRADVYVGCAPRTRARGRREDIAPAALLWADCDSSDALEAAYTFKVSPTMLVASGSTGHAHAYWALTRTLAPDALEDVNYRLARALKSDIRSTDAARILRPPGTLNHKYLPAHPVQLLDHTGLRHDPTEILSLLPASDRPRRRNPRRSNRGPDPLHRIAPSQYVRLLTGRTPNHEGKIACPFHDDPTPSLHVYKTPERGWACFGCSTPDGKVRGGDIYTFASLLWGIPTHGASFLELQARLDDVFSISRSGRRHMPTRPHRSLTPAKTLPPLPAQQPDLEPAIDR
jgi:hypothetical protein